MNENSPIRPMEFGELFGTAMTLTRRTLSNAGVLVFAVQILVVLAVAVIFRDVVALIGSMMQNPEFQSGSGSNELATRQMLNFVLIYLKFIPVVFVASILNILLTVVCIKASWMALNEEEIRIGDLIKRAFTKHFWYIIAQNFLVLLIALAGMMAASLLGTLFGVVTMGIGTVIVMLAFYGACIYYSICIMLAPHEIVIRDRGPWKSLRASYDLVKPRWWQAFGASLLLSMLVGVITSMATVPAFVAMLPAFSEFKQFQGDPHPDPRAVGEVLQHVADSFPMWVFAVYALIGSLSTLAWVNLRTAMFADLRGRRELDGNALDEVDGLEMV